MKQKNVHSRNVIPITEIGKDANSSNRDYKSLINTIPAGVFTCDSEGRITFYNEAAVKLWGSSPDPNENQIRFFARFKFWAMDGSEVESENTAMVIAIKTVQPIRNVEVLVERPDGTKFYASINIEILFDEHSELSGAIHLFQDITAIKETEFKLTRSEDSYKRLITSFDSPLYSTSAEERSTFHENVQEAERAYRESESRYRELAALLEKKILEKTLHLQEKNEELKRSEERYHKMVDEVEDYAIILLDKDGNIQNWNKGAEKIKGYSEYEIVGKNFSTFYLPEDREDGLPQRLINLARVEGKAIHEGWRMRKDGSAFWGSIVLTALHDNLGNIIGFTKVTRDLTERKVSEDRMKEYTSQLEFQNKELEQFAYAASHDMKEPLRKIQIYNSAIVENARDLLDEKSKDYLDRSINAAKRMNILIDDLLTYSKTTAKLESLEIVDLNEVVDEIILMHKDEYEQTGVQIIHESLPEIYAIPFQVKQLISNLVSNAIKYKHPDREIEICIKAELVTGSSIQDREAETRRRYHKISVIDNGIGFNSKYAEKIFNIFQRLNNLPSAQGSGIGLAICKRIAQNHHGFIRATGKENAGARFDVYFPL